MFTPTSSDSILRPMRKISYFLLLCLLSHGSIASAAELKPGDMAPNFTALDDQGKNVSLRDFRGKAVVLYFYPKDDTPGCTVEAISFRDHHDEFARIDTVILGISFDSPESHRRFKAKHQLPFSLLSDSDRKIAEAYGAKGTLFASRDVIMIDDKGRVVKVLRSVDPSKVVGILLAGAK
jgi:peroxiredoxin Q/BCP